MQLLRTYPRRAGRYPFAPDGERSVARGYSKALHRARRLVYLEDQYLWSVEVATTFAEALRARPELLLIAVLPHHPDQDGRTSLPPNLVGRQRALALIRGRRRRPGRRSTAPENHAGTPVYVHAKVCVVDDVWASVGSDNVNRRSWTHDSELSAAVLDETVDDRPPRPAEDAPRRYARDLRLALAREHLDRADGDDGDLLDPGSAFDAFRRAAAALQDWHDRGRSGPRPPGRLRPLADQPLSRFTRLWATPLYHAVYDPDGRPRPLRRRRAF